MFTFVWSPSGPTLEIDASEKSAYEVALLGYERGLQATAPNLLAHFHAY
jgi:hypothetical protein